MRYLATISSIAAVIVLLIVGLSAVGYQVQHSCASTNIKVLAGNVSCEVYSGRLIEG